MSNSAQSKAWSIHLSSTQKVVLLCLAHHADLGDGIECSPSIKTLHVMTGLDRKTVIACLANLESYGLITINRVRAGKNNSYVVHMQGNDEFLRFASMQSDRKDDIREVRRKFNSARQALYKQVVQRDGERCQVTGSTEDLTLDHILPISQGGTNEIENLRLVTRSVNSKKGACIQ